MKKYYITKNILFTTVWSDNLDAEPGEQLQVEVVRQNKVLVFGGIILGLALIVLVGLVCL